MLCIGGEVPPPERISHRPSEKTYVRRMHIENLFSRQSLTRFDVIAAGEWDSVRPVRYCQWFQPISGFHVAGASACRACRSVLYNSPASWRHCSRTSDVTVSGLFRVLFAIDRRQVCLKSKTRKCRGKWPKVGETSGTVTVRKKFCRGKQFIGYVMFGLTPMFSSIIHACWVTAALLVVRQRVGGKIIGRQSEGPLIR